MIFASQSAYFYGMLLFESVQYIIVLICVCMMLFSKGKRGLNDIVSRTSVVEIN